MKFTDIFIYRQVLASTLSRLILIVGPRAIAATVFSQLRWRHIMKLTDIFIQRQLLAGIFNRLILIVGPRAIATTVTLDSAGSTP